MGDRARSLGPGTSVELPHLALRSRSLGLGSWMELPHLALRSRSLGFGTWVERVPHVARGPDRSGPPPARGSLLVVGRS